jgi:NTP pyrophosphatase (non-canonical NTP hydrolase)
VKTTLRLLLRWTSTAWTQLLKGFSEMGELADATIKHDEDGIIDAVGDVMVCLVNYCAIKDISWSIVWKLPTTRSRTARAN